MLGLGFFFVRASRQAVRQVTQLRATGSRSANEWDKILTRNGGQEASKGGRQYWRHKSANKLPEADLWADLFANPREWWDDRQRKRVQRSPDFRHRTRMGWVLWAFMSDGGRKTRVPDLYTRLAAMDGGPEEHKPLRALPERAAWDELFARPWYWKDNRRSKFSATSPDFKHKATQQGLWLNSAPQWVLDRQRELDQSFFGRKPEMGLSEDMKAALAELAAEQQEAEQFQSAAGADSESSELKWTSEQQQQGVDILLSSLEHSLTEEAEPPPEAMRGGLQQHQRQGLAWMLRREAQVPAGGMLCDQQGLGKTMQAIALVAARPCPPENVSAAEAAWAALDAEARPARGSRAARQRAAAAEAADAAESDSECEPERESGTESELESELESEAEAAAAAERLSSGDGASSSSSSAHTEHDLLPIKATLVIVPKSLLGQWKAEIEEWTGLKVLVYAGASAVAHHQLPQQLVPYDVVLASPSMVLHDSPLKQDRVLFRAQWWRVIVDEAQCIKQHRTACAGAACLLQVQPGGARWLLSGTPVQNSPGELFSYLQFLRYEPFNTRAAFHRLFQGGDLDMVVARSAEIVRPIILRRTKASTIDGRPIVDLPQRNVALQGLAFQEWEAQFYESVSSQFARAIQETKGEMSCSAGLQQLQQLRAACDHPWLAKGTARLFEQLDRGGGGFGGGRGGDDGPRRLKRQLEELHGPFRPSAKMLALLAILEQHAATEKVLVFSLWTSMLDLVEVALADAGGRWPHRRLDGQMSGPARERCVAEFKADADVRVLLVSLLAGKEGLNLANASRVVLLEPHFNPMHEQQGIDRAHRMGQTRDVHAYKLFVRGTVEEKLLKLQEHKLSVAGGIILETQAAGEAGAVPGRRLRTGLTSADLEYLLRPDAKHVTFGGSEDEE